MCKKLVIIILASILLSFANAQSTFTMFDKVKSGFKFAETFLKLDKSSGVAKLVSETFGNLTSNKYKDSSLGSGIITGFFKILGFNAKKIGAIAINGLIFLAQLLGTSLSIKPPSRLLKAREIKHLHLENPFSWMLDNMKVNEMISKAGDRNLPDEIIEYIKERSLDEETGCVQMLVCKISPFIWGMQRFLGEVQTGNASQGGPKVMHYYLPAYEDLQEQSDECERKHHYCFYDEL